MTLTEVLVASVLLVILTVGLSSSFVHNIRDAKLMTYRTQTVTTALGVLERVRAIGWADLVTAHGTATSSTPTDLRVYIVDPTYTPLPADTDVPFGHRPIKLRINVKDGVEISSAWSQVQLPINTDTTSTIPMELWLSLTKNESLLTMPKRQYFEAIIVYRWKAPGISTTWRYGNVRLVIPNTSALLRQKAPAT
ncbi:hypothetical protein DB347_19090 [Opitutaceae bacterium EW11]|nr:hypothetical protein DB347_19090 [Opitutaceae bacterium EW11]